MEIILTEPSDETRQLNLPAQRTNLIPCSPASAGSPILSIFNRHFHIMSNSDGSIMASPIHRNRHTNSQGAFLASSAFASVTSPLKLLLRAAGIDAVTVRVLCCACDSPDQLRILIRKQPVEFATLVPPVADRIKIVKLLASLASAEEEMSPHESNPCSYRSYRFGSTKSTELQCDMTKFILPFNYADDQFHYLNSSTAADRRGEEDMMAGPSICSITIPPNLLSITLAVPLSQTNEEVESGAGHMQTRLHPIMVGGPNAATEATQNEPTSEPFSVRIPNETDDTEAPPNADQNEPSEEPVPTAASPHVEEFGGEDTSPVSATDLMSAEPIGLVLSSRALKRVGRRGVREVSVIHIDGNGNAIVGGGVIEYADGTKIFDLHPRLTKFLLILGVISSMMFVAAAVCAIVALVLPYYRGNRMLWSALRWKKGPSFLEPGSSTSQSYDTLPLCEDVKNVLIGVFSLLLFGAVSSLACAICFLYFRRYNRVFLFLPAIPVVAMIPISYMLFVHVMGVRGACGNRYAIIESEDYEVLRGTWMVVAFIATYIAAYCLRLGIEYAPVVCSVRFPLARLVTPTPPLMASPSGFSPILHSASSPIPIDSQGSSLSRSSSSENESARRSGLERRGPIANIETDSDSVTSSHRVAELSPAVTPRYPFHEPTNRPPALDTVGAAPPRFPPPPLRFRPSPSSPPRSSRQVSQRNQGLSDITSNSPF